jgi:3-phenylpropionate/cinnamic acid dioxygenase small subunit
MMQRIWRLPDDVRSRYDVSSLETVMCTGAPSPAWLKRAWIEWLGPEKIWEAYGGTERIAGTMIDGVEWLAHPGSVGRPTLGRQVRILDEQGRELPPGRVGEVYMMPPGGQGSTYRYIGAEAPATADGWETLGDMGWLDEDGYLYLVDRKTDMILSGGANVYPAEVEAAIDAHPAVRSSAVIGLPDEDLGQRVHALVDAPHGVSEGELRAHLAEYLVRYKIPRTIEFVRAPLRDDAGKLRRSALREERLHAAARSPARGPQPGGTMAPLSTPEIADRIEIQDLLTRYAAALDQKDWAKLDTCFTPDAEVDYTSTGGTKGRWPEVRKWLEMALAPFPMTMHFISNSTVELSGDRARARTYVINPMGFRNPDGSLHLFTVGAYYVDELTRTPAGWRIAKRFEEQAFMDGTLPAALQIPR